MKYEKPEVVMSGSALAAIQGIGKSLGQLDSVQEGHRPSDAAYEADE